MAAEDFAEGRAVVAVTSGRGVEVVDDAEAPVAVEPVVSANGKKRGATGYDQPSALHTTGKKILEDALGYGASDLTSPPGPNVLTDLVVFPFKRRVLNR